MQKSLECKNMPVCWHIFASVMAILGMVYNYLKQHCYSIGPAGIRAEEFFTLQLGDLTDRKASRCRHALRQAV